MTDVLDNIVEESAENNDSIEQQMIDSLHNHALLIDFDSIVLPDARKVMYKSAVKHFKKSEIKLTELDFLKYFMSQSLEDAISEVLEDADKYEVELADSIEKGVRSDYKSALKKAEISAGLQKYIDLAKNNEVEIGVISALDEATATEILEKAGVTENYKLVADEELSVVKRDGWLKILKNMAVNPRGCVVLASNSKLTVAALFAEVKYIIVVPDEYSKHGDFTGADFILDSLDNDDVFATVESLFTDEEE